MENSNALSLDQAKSYIDQIDFTAVINKMIQHQGWLKSDAIQVCQMYRNFLYLNKKYDKMYKIPPSEDIDEFWHNHILDTQNYRKDCNVIFGEYLDHYPYFGIDGATNFGDLEKAFVNMQELYIKEFGEPLYAVRGWVSSMISLFKNRFKRKPKKVVVNAYKI